MKIKSRTIGYICIVLTAVIFSTMEIMLKQMQGSMAPMQIASLRFAIGGIVLIPFAAAALKKKQVKIAAKDLPFFVLTGFLCVCLSMVLYQMAVAYTTAARVAVIFSSNSILVALLAHLMLKEELKKNNIISLIIVLAAIVVIVAPWKGGVGVGGAVLSVTSSLFFAFYTVVARKRVAVIGGLPMACLTFLFGGAEILLLALLGNTALGAKLFSAIGLKIFVNIPLITKIPSYAILPFIYVCVVVTALGYVLHALALEKTSAKEAGLIFFLKPMIAPILAAIVLKETLETNMIIGIILFLIGSGIAVLPGVIEQRRNHGVH